MFARIIAVATKEIRQLRRDRVTFGMIVGIPLIQMLLFGHAINFDVRGLTPQWSTKRTPRCRAR